MGKCLRKQVLIIHVPELRHLTGFSAFYMLHDGVTTYMAIVYEIYINKNKFNQTNVIYKFDSLRTN